MNEESANKPPFETLEEFICWISAYYSAPKRFVDTEKDFKKNVETWKRFFTKIKTS